MNTNRGRTFPAEPLTQDEVQRILSRCNPRYRVGARNRALIALLYRTGLRIAEALALRPVDADLHTGSLRVLHGKGDKARTVGLDRETCGIVRAWLERRGADNGPLFNASNGMPLATRYVRTLLARLGVKAGVAKRCHPHGLRHTHAAELAHEGVPVNVIQQQLGHSNVAVTSRYLNHVAPTVLIETIQARKWSAA